MKKNKKISSKKVLAVDLGGTKVAVAVIDLKGNILEQTREPIRTQDGWRGLVLQLAGLMKPFVEKHKLKHAAIASAGPLDIVNGQLLNPTNMKTAGKYWGVVPLVRELEKKLKIKIKLENDAAAAVRAEYWMGAAKKIENIVVITLGTGVGVGVIANGELVRSGRMLHPEGGHLILSYNNKDWPCGCGNYGCAEAMLSGKNFTQYMAKKLKIKNLTGEELVRMARAGDSNVIKEFSLYGERLAVFMTSLVVLFSPEIFVLSGGFSNAADLFLPSCQSHLKELLKSRREGVDLLPLVLTSPFQDEAGLLGAAHVALG